MKALKRRHSGRRSTDSIKRNHMTLSPPVSPFISTASLIWQRSQRQKEAGCPPIFGEPELDQYGSNFMNIVPGCTFTKNNHDRSCNYQSQAHHAVTIGLSIQGRNYSNLHLELQTKLRATDHSSQPERNGTCQEHHSSHHGACSAGTRKCEVLVSVVHDECFKIMKKRRVQRIR